MKPAIRLACTLVLAAPATGGTVCFVDAAAPPGGDGSTWPTAYQFLQDALQHAADGGVVGEIHVAQGVYRPDCTAEIPEGTGDRLAAFELLPGLVIAGGYAGMEAPGVRDPQAFPTVLSGDLAGNDGPDEASRADNSLHVVTAFDVDATGRIDGLVIAGGFANGTGINRIGAGLLISGGSPAVHDCVVVDNRALGVFGAGGGAYLGGTFALVTDCVFAANASAGEGGGVVATGGAPVLAGCTWSGNDAPVGGGLRINSGAAAIIGGHFEGNTAVEGGAVHIVESATPLFSDCVFEGNSATARGGAIHHHIGAAAAFSGCQFEANTAGEAGGAVFVFLSDPPIVDCVFRANQAQMGGAIAVASASPLLAGCGFEANLAELGGAVHTADGAPQLEQCSFTGNTATGGLAHGGAVYEESGTVLLESCVLVGNSAASGGAVAALHGAGPQMSGCALHLNTAAVAGGAVLLADLGAPSITGCTIIGNTAGVAGGGIETPAVAPVVAGSTVCGNTPDPIDGDWIDAGGNVVAGECPPTCPEDLTGDGTVETTDLLMLLGQWGPCSCAADLDGDGVVAATDLLVLLAAWGDCPPAPPPPPPPQASSSGVPDPPAAHGNNPRATPVWGRSSPAGGPRNTE